MASERRHLWSGFWATSLGTLASRVLGLVRDIATASLLGLGEGGVMDAFVVAFRIPNLLRRIFGEGALAASFLPVFSVEYERDRRRAWQLVSVLFTWVAALLSALALVGEAVCALVWWQGGHTEGTRQLVGLTAAMLPYLVWICLAAQASAVLQALMNFRVPALAPILLNVCWLFAAWVIAPRYADDKLAQAYVIAAAVLVSGVLQFGVQMPALWRLGFRFDYDWAGARDAFWRVVRSMLPITLGMAVTQLNTLMDSLIAWGFSAEGGARSIAWLGNAVDYPMQTGAAAAIYYGERFYQFPVGILGLAVATAIYPLLSRHAARGDRARIGEDLTLALRLVWFLALPAGVGIMLVAGPLTSLLFERGAFTAADAARAARTIACYASGVWAYSAIPVLVRGYFAVGNRVTPARVGLIAVAINLALNLTLIWPLAENGLAISTAIAAAAQVVLLTIVFSRTASPIAWSELRNTLVKSIVATIAMAAAVAGWTAFRPLESSAARSAQAVSLAVSIGLGVVAYLAVAQLLRMPELRQLLARGKDPDS